MSSLKNKGSLMDRATKKKTKKNPRNDRRWWRILLWIRWKL
jgi:hypothetical protein